MPVAAEAAANHYLSLWAAAAARFFQVHGIFRCFVELKAI